MPAPLPMAVIGAGAIGRRHIDVAIDSPAVDLTAIVEPQAEARAALTARGLPAVADMGDVPAHVRAAVIATPTQDHCASALAALDRGWAVLVEKPIAASVDQARRMIAAAARAGLPLIVGHHRRCHPFSQAARAALEDIGEPVALQGMWSLRKHDSYFDAEWRRRPGAGPLMTNLSHEADLLEFFFGRITEVSALLSSARRGLGIEDTAALAFRHENGALGSFVMTDAGASPWSFESASSENPDIAGSGEDYIRISGTRGALTFPSLTRWEASGPGEVEWSRPLTRRTGPEFEKVDPLAEQIARFARHVAGHSDTVLCSGDAGTRALAVSLAAALSGREGRAISPGDVPGDFTGI